MTLKKITLGTIGYLSLFSPFEEIFLGGIVLNKNMVIVSLIILLIYLARKEIKQWLEK